MDKPYAYFCLKIIKCHAEVLLLNNTLFYLIKSRTEYVHVMKFYVQSNYESVYSYLITLYAPHHPPPRRLIPTWPCPTDNTSVVAPHRPAGQAPHIPHRDPRTAQCSAPLMGSFLPDQGVVNVWFMIYTQPPRYNATRYNTISATTLIFLGSQMIFTRNQCEAQQTRN